MVVVSVLKSGFATFFVTHVETCGEQENCSEIFLVLCNAPGHTSFLDYFHSNRHVVCLPPSTTQTSSLWTQGVVDCLKNVTGGELCVRH
jgi:hypothetical protein